MKLQYAEQGHAHLMLFAAVAMGLLGFVGFNVYSNNTASLENATTAAAKQKKVKIVKQDVAMRILPRTDDDKKNAIGYVEISVPNVSLERKHCSGKVEVGISPAGSDGVVKNMPLRYVKMKQWNDGRGYCAVRVLTQGNKSGVGAWDISANFKGNKYLNALPIQTGTVTNAKKDVEITVAKSDNKKELGYIEFKVPGTDLKRHHCSGKVQGVNVVSAANPSKELYKKDRSLGLRYTKNKNANSGLGYCVAKLPKVAKKQFTSDLQVSLQFNGNDFLNNSDPLTLAFRNQ